MGKGSKQPENGVRLQSVYTWEEIKEHDSRTDKWIVVNQKVYDISNFMKRHPGGARVIGAYGGQDATVGQFINIKSCFCVCFKITSEKKKKTMVQRY